MAPLWISLAQQPRVAAAAMWLMQDGSVLAHMTTGVGSAMGLSTRLVTLQPDELGSYANGYWMDAGNLLLEKLNYASAVLSDGRLITCGGEQSGPDVPPHTTETNFCEIYDPVTAMSSPVAPPPGWTGIGDSPSVVLPDGTFMIGNTQGKGDQVALLDPKTLTWTFGVGDSSLGYGANEQGYTLLQSGDVLTAGVYSAQSKRYRPEARAFDFDAGLPVMLGDGSEIGPGLTLMDGRVVWFGANGHTCVYTPGTGGGDGRWAQVSDMPLGPGGDQLATIDSTAILEPNGRVFLVSWGPSSGVIFLEYDPVQDTYTTVPNSPPTGNREGIKMLLLPSGNALASVPLDTDNGWYEVMFDTGGDPAWAPRITSFPATVTPGATVVLEGLQLCGLSECQSYGDDNQQAEHYPTVRFTGDGGRVYYARAHDVSTRSIAPLQPGSVAVDVPLALPPGPCCVEAVAMGIPSACVPVKAALSDSFLQRLKAAIVVILFGGVIYDAPGRVFVNGGWLPVPGGPGPVMSGFDDLSQDVRDALIGQTIARMASALGDAATGRAIRELALSVGPARQSQPAPSRSDQTAPAGGRAGLNALILVSGLLVGLVIGVLGALFSAKLL